MRGLRPRRAIPGQSIDKLPRKMTMDMLGTTTEMLFTNWGGDVSVEAPPADQITTTAPGL